MEPLRVLILTMLYPNPARPTQAVFTAQRVQALAAHAAVQVVAPIGWFPGQRWLSRWRAEAQVPFREVRPGPLVVPPSGGLEVWHPRFLAPPGLGRSTRGLAYFLGTQPLLTRLHGQHDFHVVHAHFAWPDGVAAALVARRWRRPLVLTVLGSDLNVQAQSILIRGQIRWALRQADQVSAVSQALRARVLAFGVPAERITVIPTGVDVRWFHPLDRAAARARLGWPQTGKLVLFVGNLLPVKGVVDLLDAFAQLRARRGDVGLALVGEGPLRGEVERRARTSPGLTLVGPRPHHEVPQWLGACDVLCLPSLAEGLPNVVQEALACGRPVVASAVGGVPELIPGEHCGLLVPPRQPGRLAEALNQALERSWSEEVLVGQVRDRSWETIGRRDVALLRRAVSGRKGAFVVRHEAEWRVSE